MNTNSNSYTIIYASVMVVIVAFLLAFVSSSLRETQNKNVELDTKKQILAALNKHGIKDIEEANQICESYGIDPYMECESTQMICFENAKWAYVVGTAIALKEKAKDAVEAAEYIGEGLQAFCIPGSVADDRKVGIGHGRLAARLLSPETKCFAFLAGHESFAAAEGAIKIAQMANQSRPADKPLRCILVRILFVSSSTDLARMLL